MRKPGIFAEIVTDEVADYNNGRFRNIKVDYINGHEEVKVN